MSKISKELAWSENTAELKRKTFYASNLKTIQNILVFDKGFSPYTHLFMHVFLHDMELFGIWISRNQNSFPPTAPQ